MFRRPLQHVDVRNCLDRLSNRLTKIISEARKLARPWSWADRKDDSWKIHYQSEFACRNVLLASPEGCNKVLPVLLLLSGSSA